MPLSSSLPHLSATTLLPGQDNSGPSAAISGAASFVVSCGFRVSEVGFSEIVNRRSLINGAPAGWRRNFRAAAGTVWIQRRALGTVWEPCGGTFVGLY